jgi:hypothetical protein
MPANFKVGSKVQQVLPVPIQGEVVRIGMVEDELGYLVRSSDGSERWFKESDLEELPE